MPPQEGNPSRDGEANEWMGEMSLEPNQMPVALPSKNELIGSHNFSSMRVQDQSPFSRQMQQEDLDIYRLENEMRSMRISHSLQSSEIGRLRHELEHFTSSQGNPSIETGFMMDDHRFRFVVSEKMAEVTHLRQQLDKSVDSQMKLGAEIACLQGELQNSMDVQADQQMEIVRLRQELENSNNLKQQHVLRISLLYKMLDTMNSVDVLQLEDYAIQSLQLELKSEARRGGPSKDSDLLEAPEDYTGCRQFFQTGVCHFGRGRRPCPNEKSHLCLHCGRSHGTAPHLILMRRMRDHSLSSRD